MQTGDGDRKKGYNKNFENLLWNAKPTIYVSKSTLWNVLYLTPTRNKASLYNPKKGVCEIVSLRGVVTFW